MASIFKQDELQQAKGVCEHWLKYFAGADYVDDEHNRDVIINYIKYNLKGEVTTQTLNEARDKCYADLHGFGVAWTPEQKAARTKEEADRKKAEDLQNRIEANTAVAINYIKTYAPTGLIVGGDFYGSTSDKIVAFIKNKYPDQPLSNEQITDAIRTLWSSLDFFDRSPAALEFRNMAKPERKLSRQARIDAGLELAEDPRNHSLDSALKNPAVELQKVFKKATAGVESSDQIAAESLAVMTKTGRYDHGFNSRLRETFMKKPNGEIDWKGTRRVRTEMCDEYEKRRNRDGGQRG
jgi:hypothetical protein